MIIDMHIHSKFSDGKESIESIKDYTIKKKIQNIGIADHALGWGVHPFFSTGNIFRRYIEDINKYSNDKLKILKGLECDIGPGGQLITSPVVNLETARENVLDYVIASFHPERMWFNGFEDLTSAMFKSVGSSLVDIVGHPLSPLYNYKGNGLDYLQRLYEALHMENIKNHKISFELNRREYSILSKKGKEDSLFFILEMILSENIVPLSFGSDAHNLEELNNFDFITKLEKNLGKPIEPKIQNETYKKYPINKANL